MCSARLEAAPLTPGSYAIPTGGGMPCLMNTNTEASLIRFNVGTRLNRYSITAIYMASEALITWCVSFPHAVHPFSL